MPEPVSIPRRGFGFNLQVCPVDDVLREIIKIIDIN
jgi:hypothetical protein